MTLFQALHILARAHTKGDAEVGYTVETYPRIEFQPFTRAEYVEAWGVVRTQLNFSPEDR